MATYLREQSGFGCSNCGVSVIRHGQYGECPPRDISQRVSRVVAAPSTPFCQGGTGHCGSEWCGICARVAKPEPHPVDGRPWCAACEAPEICGACRALREAADIAAFRALSAEQRAALLQIGADGQTLLDAARACAEETAECHERLGAVVDRIDARKA